MAGTTATRFAQNEDGEFIAYRTVGEGERDIVLLVPGSAIDLLADDPVFVALEARLAALGRLIYFDWRGFGSSDPLVGLPTPEGWMDDTRVVLDAVGSTSAVVVAPVANGSMGVLFAASHPERTAALVLVDAWARMARDDDHAIGFPPDVLASFVDVLVQAYSTGEVAAFDAPSRADDPAFRAWHARTIRLTVPLGHVRRYWEWNLGVDARPALGAVTAPTLVLHHERNAFVPLEHGRHLADRIEGARFEVLPGPADSIFFGRASSRAALDHIEAFITGAPPAGEIDRMLATVLFTDIVGSTEAAVRLGDTEWRRLLDRHDEVVAAQLAGPGEVLVSSTVRDLVTGSGLEFEDRGQHRLKGLPEPWRISALVP